MGIGSNGLAVVIAIVVFFALAALWCTLVVNTAAADTARAAATADVADRAAQAATRQPEDLRLLLDAMSRSCAPSLHRGGLRLDIRLPSEALTVHVASDDLHALLARIVEHAAEVLGQGATLQVFACAEGSQAVVRWRESDVAEGRPKLAQFLDAKGRALSASALACERIVHRHGGRIYAAPSALGGLGLTLRLPLVAEAATAAEAGPQDGCAPRAPHALMGAACVAVFSLTACQHDGEGDDARASASLSTLAPIMAVVATRAPIAVDHEATRRAARSTAPKLARSAGDGIVEASALPDN